MQSQVFAVAQPDFQSWWLRFLVYLTTVGDRRPMAIWLATIDKFRESLSNWALLCCSVGKLVKRGELQCAFDSNRAGQYLCCNLDIVTDIKAPRFLRALGARAFVIAAGQLTERGKLQE